MNRFSITGIDGIHRIQENPYSHFMPHQSVYDALSQGAAEHRDRRALTFITAPDPEADGQSWTYAAFMDRLRQAANLFAHLAAGETPRIAMLLPAMPQAYFTLFGGETAGTVCPVNYLLDAAHVADLVRASGANIVVALGPNAELDIWSRVADLPATCPQLRHLLAVGGAPRALDFDAELIKLPGDTLRFDRSVDAHTLAALFHTGGTTGKPKLAQHTHGNQLHAAWGAAQMVAMAPSDVVLNGFPLFHVAGSLVYGLSTLLSGGELVLPTLTGLRNRQFMDHCWAFVEKHRVTVLAAVPTVIATLLTVSPAQADLSSVRILLTGGSPLPDALAEGFERQFRIGVRNILGMTECAGVIAIEPVLGPRVPGSCGLALPFTRVYTVGDDGEELPAGATGVLCLTGPNVGPGYTEARHNAGTFTPGGELVTGDIGRVGDDGKGASAPGFTEEGEALHRRFL